MATGGSPNELWHQCARWLTQCGLLRGDHKANWPEATVADLAYTLRDGVILCSLLKKLDPDCIDLKMVNQKPQMAQFLCLRNIKTFLLVCKESFHLEDHELFEPEELFDLSNFLKVLQTLSRLSRCQKVQRKSVQGFDASLQHSDSQEDIYRSLNNSELPDNELEVEYSSYDETTEEIYQDLCKNRKHNDLPAWLNASHTLEKRDYVIKELVETEKNYIEVLQNLQTNFMRPLVNHLQHKDHSIIFCNIKELTDVHTRFFSNLQEAVIESAQCAMRIGKVFQVCQSQFLLYGEYCANLPVAQDLLNELCSKSDNLTLTLERLQEEANQGKFKLRDILSVPMQRILKYQLLLEKLLQETGPHHDDAKHIERARDAMIDVAQFINEVKRDADTLKIISDIERSISEWDMPAEIKLKDYGRLIKDGELRIKDHSTTKMQARYVFVFDQVMIMCKTKSDQYKFRDCIHIGDYKMEDGSGRRTLQGNARWSFQWFLIHKREQTAYTLYARNMDDRCKWMKAIRDAMDNMNPKGCSDRGHHFLMHTLEQPQHCILCRKYLKGSIYQGYRCEHCLLVVHKDCIQAAGVCGGANNPLPPVLPPRPPLPVNPPQTHMPLGTRHENGDANNFNWDGFLWYAGEISRDAATSALQNEPDGTYLLRVRPQRPTNQGETDYALSLKTDSRVKHMKVYQKLSEGRLVYFLSESRLFPSIEDLIRFYEHTSLSENFHGLDVTLQLPFRRREAIVRYDFHPTPLEDNQLTLRVGTLVTIISKEGDQKGWWKGRVGSQVGFFPKDYVSENSVPEQP
ncbi:protein vav isoform X2 [Neocloeon triangulifer]|uniref:protein vav isoform X2 n=1 Tax=Neocloeon triangulifer TaxID=2078957 RepID=UPI00286F733C|nr:protein vav isoform X2 [Neocloeon triangulifer]